MSTEPGEPGRAGGLRDEPRRTTRRRFLKTAGLGILATALGGTLDALVVEPRWIRVTFPVVPIPLLPSAWDGVRIAQLTDLHVGPYVGLDHVRRAVDTTLDESPDLIVLTGDYVSRTRAVTPEFGAELARLRAPLGQFAVLGNHDYWTHVTSVTAMLQAAGIRLLTNTHVLLERDRQVLCLAGVDDLWEGKQLLDAALAGVPGDVPRVLLCHNPDYAEQMPAVPRVDLMLCGHTHGGQVKIPFGPRPRLPVRHAKYGAGLNRGPHCRVYTSCGIGMVGVPVRFNCRPELPVVTLRRADGGR